MTHEDSLCCSVPNSTDNVDTFISANLVDSRDNNLVVFINATSFVFWQTENCRLRFDRTCDLWNIFFVVKNFPYQISLSYCWSKELEVCRGFIFTPNCFIVLQNFYHKVSYSILCLLNIVKLINRSFKNLTFSLHNLNHLYFRTSDLLFANNSYTRIRFYSLRNSLPNWLSLSIGKTWPEIKSTREHDSS